MLKHQNFHVVIGHGRKFGNPTYHSLKKIIQPLLDWKTVTILSMPNYNSEKQKVNRHGFPSTTQKSPDDVEKM